MDFADPKTVATIAEKLQAAQESVEQSTERYCELLELIEKISDNINGHPAKAVKNTEKMSKDLEELMDQLGEIFDEEPSASSSTPTWHYLVVIFMSLVSGFAGGLIHHFMSH